MMICDYCGKKIKGGYYKHGKNGSLCGYGDWFKKQFWKDTLDNNVIIVKGIAYHKDTTKKGLHCNVKVADGTIKDMWLWYNGIIPKEYNVKDNAEFV